MTLEIPFLNFDKFSVCVRFSTTSGSRKSRALAPVSSRQDLERRRDHLRTQSAHGSDVWCTQCTVS